MTRSKIDFKDPQWITTWLDAALEKEQEKYERCPVLPDMVPGHDSAQGWGFVVAGYFLVEQSFKALAHVRGKSVPTKHSLTMLFGLLVDMDQDVLREYYLDFRATIGGDLARFPFATLDEFLSNLDGDPKPRGDDYLGSFDWRYFPIENERSSEMPTVSIEYLHEVAYGTIAILERSQGGVSDPRRCTRSFRLRWARERAVTDWLHVRMNAEDEWDPGHKIEKLWGPDYKGRFDYFLFRGTAEKMIYGFGPIPEQLGLPVIDMRPELDLPDTPSF